MRRQKRTLHWFGPFRLDPNRRLLFRGDDVIPLPGKAFETLLALVESEGKLLTKDSLLRRVWPDTFVEEGNLNVNICAIRRALGESPDEHRYILTVPGHGYQFVGMRGKPRAAGRRLEMQANRAAGAENSHERRARPGPARSLPPDSERLPPGPARGALALDSRFYIFRSVDAELQLAIERQDSVVLIKGARQVGKTSLLARGLDQARQAGARVAVTDCQSLDASVLRSAETFYLSLTESITEQLGLSGSADRGWSPHLGPGVNFERFLAREVLTSDSPGLVWALDEVDRLFGHEFASDVFSLLRSWHNKRALDPGGRWHRLTLAVAYATEPHLFITDLNQSPFNIGTRLTLEDFTPEQVWELNCRYGSPLGSAAGLARYLALVGGHPYLAHRGLWEMATHGISPAAIEATADREEGPFGDHLHRLFMSLARDGLLVEAARSVLQGRGCPSVESFYRLRAAGVISGETESETRLRCGLYARYLARQLP